MRNFAFGKNSPSDLVHGKLALQKVRFPYSYDIVVCLLLFCFVSILSRTIKYRDYLFLLSDQILAFDNPIEHNENECKTGQF